MLANLKKIHLETWLGIGSYVVAFSTLYRMTHNAMGEPLGSAIFALFLGVGLAIPIYLVSRTLARLGMRAYHRSRPAPEVVPFEAVEKKVDDGKPEKRFRLARHGSIDPTYGRPKSNAVSTASTRR